MLTNKRERARQQRAALWATRDNVQRHALSMSMPWLAFVNIAFALMIFFRNFIFTYFDKRLLTHRAVIPYIEAALIAVIIISAILVIIAVTPRLAQGRYTLNIITGLLLALSLCWSLSNYCFIFFLDLALCLAAAGDINDYRPHRAVSPLARHYRFYAAALGDRLAGGNTAPLSHRDPLFDPLGHFYRDFAVWPTYFAALV